MWISGLEFNIKSLAVVSVQISNSGCLRKLNFFLNTLFPSGSVSSKEIVVYTGYVISHAHAALASACVLHFCKEQPGHFKPLFHYSQATGTVFVSISAEYLPNVTGIKTATSMFHLFTPAVCMSETSRDTLQLFSYRVFYLYFISLSHYSSYIIFCRFMELLAPEIESSDVDWERRTKKKKSLGLFIIFFH